MKIKASILLSIFAIGLSTAQDFQGMAVYESKTSTSDMMSNFAGNREITPDVQKRIEERMKAMFEKTFVLNFDRNSSIYKEEEKIEQPGQQGGGGRGGWGSMMGGGGTHYKNVKEKSFSIDREFFGKEFLILDTLPKLAWKLGTESKQIGSYMCFKATAVRPVSQSDFRNFRKKKEETAKDTTAVKENKSTNFMDQWEMPKEIEIVAWYTPDIPINQGPENYWGLPGLILEVSDGKTVILCSKVVLNTKDKKEIKAPKKGKVVTQAEYDKIVTEKMAEMREMGGRGGFGRGRQ